MTGDWIDHQGGSVRDDCGADGMTWKIVTSNDLAKRFFAKVSFEPMSGCWLWIGSTTPKGYGQIQSEGRVQPAHRVAWVMLVSSIPEGKILDHKCHNRCCVNPEHLRIVTNTENIRNSVRSKANTTGFKGVTRRKDCNRWLAQIKVDRRNINLGNFESPELAHEAYKKAAVHYFGTFANFGAAS